MNGKFSNLLSFQILEILCDAFYKLFSIEESEFGVKICRLSFFFLIFGTPRVGSGEIGCSRGSFVEPDVSHFLHVLSQLSPPLTQPLYTPCLVYNSANKYFRITLNLANAKKFTILLFDLYKFPVEVFYDYYYYN